MIHPSYVELMDVVNHEVEKTGEDPVVNSRYSIVCATAKRAREIIDGDEPLVREKSNKPLSVAVDELYSGELKILTEDEVQAGESLREVYEKKLSELEETEKEIREIEKSKRAEEMAMRAAAEESLMAEGQSEAEVLEIDSEEEAEEADFNDELEVEPEDEGADE